MEVKNKKTAIPISLKVRQALDKEKRLGESDDNCIRRKLKENEK